MLEKLKVMREDYIGIVETFFCYHVGSWFYAVSGAVFNEEYFRSHWRRYRPTSNRRREIKMGEEGMTKMLLKERRCPVCLVQGRDSHQSHDGHGSVAII